MGTPRAAAVVSGYGHHGIAGSTLGPDFSRNLPRWPRRYRAGLIAADLVIGAVAGLTMVLLRPGFEFLQPYPLLSLSLLSATRLLALLLALLPLTRLLLFALALPPPGFPLLRALLLFAGLLTFTTLTTARDAARGGPIRIALLSARAGLLPILLLLIARLLLAGLRLAIARLARASRAAGRRPATLRELPPRVRRP